MHIDMYRTFLVLARTESFSKAAVQLNVVQSTVSSRIVELERYLNKQLFTRTKRSVAMTHAGKVFMPYAEKMVALEAESIDKLETMNLYEDRLKICIVGSLYREKLASVIESFYKDNPEFELNIQFKISDQQVDMLLKNEIDIGFINRIPKAVL